MNFCISEKVYNCKDGKRWNQNFSLLKNPDQNINELQQLVLHDDLLDPEAGSVINSSAAIPLSETNFRYFWY
jgi:hypothetical protein